MNRYFLILSIYSYPFAVTYPMYNTPVPTKGIKDKKELKEIYEQEKEDGTEHFAPEVEKQHYADDDSRFLAIVLIGIASFYVLFMIIYAYNNKRSSADQVDEETQEYEYTTESYDFQQYQSIDDERRSLNRGFHYNESIQNSAE